MSTEQPEREPRTLDEAEDERHRRHAELVERLFREHNEALIRFLLARLRSYQEARDVAQEAYVRMLSLHEPGAVSYLRAFLFRTAANLAVDRMRRDEVHGRATDSPFFDDFTDVRTPERQVAASQSIQRLERVLAAMPVKCRRAFLMRRCDGMDLRSIGRELGLSTRMVSLYVARALLQCRAHLDLELSRDSEDDDHG